MRCDGCKHWDLEAQKTYAAGALGECTRAHSFWDRSRWIEDEDSPSGEFRLNDDAKDDLMFVQDGSDYRATLLTRPEFFCAHFEPR